MRGRTPKPTSLKLVTGNPGKRATNKQEPDPDYLRDLTPPAWLPARAKAVWDELAPRLSKAKLLTEVDAEAFAQGCVAIANFRYTCQRVGDDLVKSKHVAGEDDSVVEVGEHLNPWELARSMCFKQAHIVFDKFGMTPAARTRIAIKPQGDLFGNEASPTKKYFG
jgi:P27 family predicted phage terminase small subunit